MYVSYTNSANIGQRWGSVLGEHLGDRVIDVLYLCAHGVLDGGGEFGGGHHSLLTLGDQLFYFLYVLVYGVGVHIRIDSPKIMEFNDSSHSNHQLLVIRNLRPNTGRRKRRALGSLFPMDFVSCGFGH
jgi:hypothetical protein